MMERRWTRWMYGLVAASVGVSAAACRSARTEAPLPEVRPAAPSGVLAPAAMPHVVIYKMKNDYSRNVPVTMDASRRRIAAYPAPSDLRRGDGLALPVPLIRGYWLDNRGVGERTAFLSYTYEEYARLDSAPSMAELMAAIVDSDPMEAVVDCGLRSSFGEDLVKELCDYIRSNDLK